MLHIIDVNMACMQSSTPSKDRQIGVEARTSTASVISNMPTTLRVRRRVLRTRSAGSTDVDIQTLTASSGNPAQELIFMTPMATAFTKSAQVSVRLLGRQ